MTRKMILPLVFGILGTVALLWLGGWQVSRLTWKTAILADIEDRIAAAPVAVPDAPDATEHRYLPVTATGVAQAGVRVFTSVKGRGAGHRIISVFTIAGADGPRRILLDQGFRAQGSDPISDPAVEITVTGNLHWPDEVDSFTPPPDITPGGQIWYARDIPAIAMSLNAEPVLIVARRVTPDSTIARPLPLTTGGIPNDHLGYAITWFSLAFVWMVMTAVVLWRIRQRTI